LGHVGKKRLIVAATDFPFNAAVTVALWFPGIVAAAVALKVELVAPAITVVVDGTGNSGLLLDNEIAIPPAGADWVSITVQVLTAVCPRLLGLHARAETITGANRPILTVCELLARLAVTVALWLLAIEAAAVALKVAVVAPAGTVTDGGTVSSGLLLVSVTLDPPVGAAWVSVTEHVLVPPVLNVAGEQVIGWSDGTLIVPPAADVTLRPSPFGSTPIGPDIWIDAMVVAGATVTFR
jgi:hypothetical protein